MTCPTHMMLAVAIYKSIKNKPAGFALAFASHFLIDAIPHYDLNLTANFFLIMMATGFFLFVAWNEKDYFILLAACMGVLPDMIKLSGLSQTFSDIHALFHFKGIEAPIQLLVMELVVFFLLGLLVIL